MPTYRLKFTVAALAEWKALDGSVKEPLRKLLKKRLLEPYPPGSALQGALSGCYKIKPPARLPIDLHRSRRCNDRIGIDHQ